MIFTSVIFECIHCGGQSNIYFENNFDPSEVRELAKCNECGIEGNCNVGDLGYRNDLSNPDYPPWQAQIIRVNPSAICCDQCLAENGESLSDINLSAICESCNQESMVSGKKVKVENQQLSELLKLLSKTYE